MLAILGLLAVLLLIRCSYGGTGDYMVSRPDVAPCDYRPATNHGSSAIARGSVVCQDLAITDSDAGIQIVKRSNGVAVPASANLHRIMGILDNPRQEALAAGASGLMVVEGLCKALVYVPANITVPEGTGLVLRGTWVDASDIVSWGSTLTPVLHGGATPTTICVPANPIAFLKAEIASSTSARTVLAWVELPMRHRPIPFTMRFQLPAANVDLGPVPLFRGLGPYQINGLEATLADMGSAGVLSWQGTIRTIEATPQTADTFSTAPVVDNDASNGFLQFTGSDSAGDTDNASDGTTGVPGVLGALTKRQGHAHSLYCLTLDHTGGTAQANYTAIVEGHWL